VPEGMATAPVLTESEGDGTGQPTGESPA
jgi:hypothetical protein